MLIIVLFNVKKKPYEEGGSQIKLSLQQSFTVESLHFVVAQFWWNLWVPLIHELTHSMN